MAQPVRLADPGAMCRKGACLAQDNEPVETLSLDGWHRARGGRMVPFAGYAMPVQYEGIVAEHEWTRGSASLFDVSHMGQIIVSGNGSREALEALLPADLKSLSPGHVRYSLLLDDNGGVIDDLMITNMTAEGEGEQFYLVVNGATKHGDIAWLRSRLPEGLHLNHLTDQALIALQGPKAAEVLETVLPGIADGLYFMKARSTAWDGVEVGVARSGYTGEDGFEITLPASHAEKFADALVADERVKPAGLGARDSLRLEAGLPLYGHDLTPLTDPVSADLGFAISKRRRMEGGFPGAVNLLSLLKTGTATKRIGLALNGRLPAREGATVMTGADEIGTVTSGGFSPTLGHPIAMAYVSSDHAEPGAQLAVEVRGRRLDARVVPMPFVPHNYHRKGAAR